MIEQGEGEVGSTSPGEVRRNAGQYSNLLINVRADTRTPELAMSSSTPNAKPPQSIPLSKPIDILQTQPSQLYANLHPVLLISLLLFSFKNLVEDPVNTLLGIAPTIAIIQAVYCVICLPSTGQAPAPAPKPGQKKKAAKPSQDIWAKVVVWLTYQNTRN